MHVASSSHRLPNPLQASLRLPPSTSRATLESKVNQVLRDLSLTHIADSRIGTSDNGGISGGERKRVAIGMELVCDPGMMFCDEPTSGLDSANAELVVQVRRNSLD
jgi:ATP-binding cassette subfamily G (WHITE) protein 2